MADVAADSPHNWLLSEAAQRGCKTVDGLSMFIEQAAIGFQLWTGVDPRPPGAARGRGRVFGIVGEACQARVPGLFITGTDTGVGKTYVGALIARSLVQSGRRVGVYKPAASGCRREGRTLVSDDAVALWNAAGRPGDLDHVCPQRFAAPLAPHLAARAEGKQLDVGLLRRGIEYWQERAEIILVEGAGGLMSPLGEDRYVADLAAEFGFPLLVVSQKRTGNDQSDPANADRGEGVPPRASGCRGGAEPSPACCGGGCQPGEQSGGVGGPLYSPDSG